MIPHLHARLIHLRDAVGAGIGPYLELDDLCREVELDERRNPVTITIVTLEGEDMSKLWATLGALLATSESVVPIFVHNPQSQQIEMAVVTSANQLFVTLAQLFGTPQPPAPPAAG